MSASKPRAWLSPTIRSEPHRGNAFKDLPKHNGLRGGRSKIRSTACPAPGREKLLISTKILHELMRGCRGCLLRFIHDRVQVL